jgi:hypothetical protein
MLTFNREGSTMKRIFFVIGLLIVSFILPIIGISCSTDNANASLGKEFTLPVGGTAVISGENLTLKFVQETADSRCATGNTCIWAGEASCLVSVTYDSKTSDMVFTQSGGSITEKDFLDKYKASFTVEPYPVAGKTIDKSDYKLVMTVTKE